MYVYEVHVVHFYISIPTLLRVFTNWFCLFSRRIIRPAISAKCFFISWQFWLCLPHCSIRYVIRDCARSISNSVDWEPRDSIERLHDPGDEDGDIFLLWRKTRFSVLPLYHIQFPIVHKLICIMKWFYMDRTIIYLSILWHENWIRFNYNRIWQIFYRNNYVAIIHSFWPKNVVGIAEIPPIR